MNLPLKRWLVAPRISAGSLPGWPDVLAQILHNRGVSEPADVDAFLNDDGCQIFDPLIMEGVKISVERIGQAISRGEMIAIYGDFDADGVTAAALLRDVLAPLGARTITYIPNRAEEGYGVNNPALESLRDQGATLAITVDCGVSAVHEIDYARQIGLDVIVVDHHQIPQQLPDAVAVINPRRSDCEYPFKDLAAVGVAFKLAQALLRTLPIRNGKSASEIQREILDLVALGTVADVAPLLGENRALVRRGLESLKRTHRPGLRQLVSRAGLKFDDIDSQSISYVLGPRLNSAGRLHDALVSYRLLTTKSDEEARELAEELETTNQERQKLTADALNRAREEILACGDVPKLIVVSGEHYPSGVVGLVAGKLMEEFYRPALVIELGDEASRGSARSIAELDITEALSNCEDLLLRYGGHARAAGFTIPNHNFDLFKARLMTIVDSRFEGFELQPSLHVDRELAFREITWDLYHLLENLAPFGYGNPVPTFLTRGMLVAEARAVGKDPLHLRLRLTDGRRSWNAIGFKLGQCASDVRQRKVDVVYSLETNEWNDRISLQLHIKDLKLS